MATQRTGAERRIIAEQAAQWVCDLQVPGFEKHAEFLAWLKRSPQHVAEFFFAETVWRETARMGPASTTQLHRIIAEARASSATANVMPLMAHEDEDPSPSGAVPAAARVRRSLPRWAAIAAAAVLLAVAMPWALGWLDGRSRTYSTAIGEQRAFKLADGSLLHLNASSRVVVRFSDETRRLRLLEGEALFTVHGDPARPFLVDAGHAVIQALGTQFNVYRRAHATTVAVLSGAVQVSDGTALEEQKPGSARVPMRLSAGEEIHISASGELVKGAPDLDAEDTLAWRERRLVFQATPLSEVAAEFNRYNRRRIVVEGAEAGAKQLSGTFDADNPDSLVLFLRKLDDLEVDSDGDSLVIRGR
jgi:transmembrane sensor